MNLYCACAVPKFELKKGDGVNLHTTKIISLLAVKMACNRFSVGSLASLSSFSSGITGVDTSFISMASTLSTVSSSFEIESEVGREAVKEICCSALSRILDFPDDQLEVLLGYDEDDQEATKESGMNVARYKALCVCN